jgi:hypothetical protein
MRFLAGLLYLLAVAAIGFGVWCLFQAFWIIGTSIMVMGVTTATNTACIAALRRLRVSP